MTRVLLHGRWAGGVVNDRGGGGIRRGRFGRFGRTGADTLEAVVYRIEPDGEQIDVLPEARIDFLPDEARQLFADQRHCLACAVLDVGRAGCLSVGRRLVRVEYAGHLSLFRRQHAEGCFVLRIDCLQDAAHLLVGLLLVELQEMLDLLARFLAGFWLRLWLWLRLR